MAEAALDLTGPSRAAILLLALGEERAAEVLRHLQPGEVQEVGTAMAELPPVAREQVDEVLNGFLDKVDSETSLNIGSDDFLRRLFVTALGPKRGGVLANRVLLGEGSKGLDALRWMAPPAIARVLRHEHPQIIAIVLAHLEPADAGRVVSLLPEGIRAEALLRVACLDGVPPSALDELEELMDREFNEDPDIERSRVNGVETAANILNNLTPGMEEHVLAAVKERDEELGERLDEAMFVFSSLVDLQDRDMQTLLREITSDVLVPALKGADKQPREKFLKNMSKRSAEILRDELEVSGPVRLSDVEAAQRTIMDTARKLSEDGQIVISRGEEFV